MGVEKVDYQFTMFPNLPPTGGQGSGESVEIPAPISAVIGRDDQQQEEWEETIRSEIARHPKTFTGEVDGDPRNGNAFPSSGSGMLNLLQSTENSVLGEEFNMAVQASSGDPCDQITPKPLSPRELDEFLELIFNGYSEDYSCWVPIEPEMVDKTAVGEYRKATEGSIIRFRIEFEETLSTFSLVPNRSRCGFSWYHLNTIPADSQMATMTIKAGESQRLESLTSESGARMLETIPDRIRCASYLLDAFLQPDNPSPTPDNWLTTNCELAEKAELLNPRYNATFAHKETDIILEVAPLEADKAINPEKSETGSDGFRVALNESAVKSPSHTWELHFADRETIEAVSEEFDREICGDRLPEIMDMVDKETNR